ncbi:MMPL family transporter [Desulfosediminicola sp.]|uniref:MMPL family transporter n=1 Tax=Desulfosediminicola sp. TaxID=2886825 RepID=UPI003AF2E9A6
MTKGSRCTRWLLVLSVVFAACWYALQLSVRDDALDLLPDGQVRHDVELLQTIGLVDRIFITFSAEAGRFASPQLAGAALKSSVSSLGERLTADDDFGNVLYRFPDGYQQQLYQTLQPYLPVLLTDDDYQIVADKITPEAIQEALKNNYLLLNTPAGMGMKDLIAADPLGLMPVLLSKLQNFRSGYSMQLDDGFLVSPDQKNFLVLAESQKKLTDSDNAEAIQKKLDTILAEVLLPGIKAEIIGTLPHTLANSRSIKHDLRVLLPAASILLVVLLGGVLRDIRILVVFAVPFLGAPPAIAITSGIYGSISGMALGFGIVILGIAVDFSVHLFLALREGKNRAEAMRAIRRPMIFATMTTLAVLCVLLFSDVPSHRQMATLAISGVVFAVGFAWLLIPTVVNFGPGEEKTASSMQGTLLPEYLQRLPGTNGGRIILVLWAGLIVCGIFSWPMLNYNADLRSLDVPNDEIIVSERHFSNVWGGGGEQAFLVSSGANLDQAVDTNDRVFHFLDEHGIEIHQTLAAILPGPQQQRQNLTAWQAFWQERGESFPKDFSHASSGYGFSDRAFLPFLQSLGGNPGIFTAEKLEGTVLGSMAGSMIRGGDKGDDTRVLTIVSFTEESQQWLQLLATEDPDVAVLANPIWRSEAERMLKTDIVVLSAIAGCLVVLLVAVQFRNLRAIVAVLAPVVSALAAMSLFCRLTGQELNMMHLIMGILVIGLAVDYGIFIVCARLSQTAESAYLAVTICAASSLIGFGVLAFASHPALSSLGITVLVGIGVACPVALLVSYQLAAPEKNGGPGVAATD